MCEHWLAVLWLLWFAVLVTTVLTLRWALRQKPFVRDTPPTDSLKWIAGDLANFLLTEHLDMRARNRLSDILSRLESINAP